MRRRSSAFVGVALMLLAAAAAHDLGATQSAGESCQPAAAAGAVDADLYCIELLPAQSIERASGTARLLPPSSPFGAAVLPTGEAIYQVLFTLRDLPEAASLGPYSAYVAWATTPQLDPVIKLGEVRNGTTRLGRFAFDRFLILITAESSAAVPERTGRLVLRGTSASVRMQPHDLAFLLAGLLPAPAAGGRAEGRGAVTAAPADPHAAHAAHGGGDGWTPPPMHPNVGMPPAMMTLRPGVSSYLPAAGDDVPLARPRELLRMRDGETLALIAAPVRRVIFTRTITMLGFNGQYPGPLIQVDEGATIVVRFTNRTDFPTAVHWHGVRLDNRFDGVPHVTQDPVAPGGTFEYRVFFRDAGLYWYHPHHREDALQDLGLYGNLLVRSRDPQFFAPANRDELLMLDDLLVADAASAGRAANASSVGDQRDRPAARIAASQQPDEPRAPGGEGPRLVGYGLESPTHALMGRFGNVLLINGEPKWETSVRRGEVVRLYLTNVASTRVFNLSFMGGAKVKVVASDLGRYEREAWVDNITIAPAERYVVDVRFDGPGEVALVNRVRAIDHIQARFFDEAHVLGVVHVSPSWVEADHGAAFNRLRHNAAVTADIDRYRGHFARPVDRELMVTLQPGDLPFPLRPMLNFESVYRNPVEWSGTMPEMDWIVTARDARWIVRDVRTGRENMDIDWRFRVGDVVKLRFASDRGALHAMQHPMHIHGQRFLVLAVNGVANEHLVWKDTVLLPTGFVVDVLLEVTNPGKWMLHCHVSEHIEAGMRMVFEVQP